MVLNQSVMASIITQEKINMDYFGYHNNYGIFLKKIKGIWTINFHINSWKRENFEELNKNLEKYKESIVDYEYVLTNFFEKKLNYFDLFKTN